MRAGLRAGERGDGLVLPALRRALSTSAGNGGIDLREPLMTPALGAVALAARTAGRELSPEAVAALAGAQAGPH